MGRADIIRFTAENWQIGVRQTEKYMADARLMIEEDANLTRQAFLAETLAGLRKVRVAAQKKGQMHVVVNAIRLQAELVGGLNGKITA